MSARKKQSLPLDVRAHNFCAPYTNREDPHGYMGQVLYHHGHYVASDGRLLAVVRDPLPAERSEWDPEVPRNAHSGMLIGQRVMDWQRTLIPPAKIHTQIHLDREWCLAALAFLSRAGTICARREGKKSPPLLDMTLAWTNKTIEISLDGQLAQFVRWPYRKANRIGCAVVGIAPALFKRALEAFDTDEVILNYQGDPDLSFALSEPPVLRGLGGQIIMNPRIRRVLVEE